MKSMRFLTLSLLLATIVAAFGMGWFVDKLYQKTLPGEAEKENSALIRLGQSYVELAERSAVPTNGSVTLDDEQSFSVALSDLSDFPLPHELELGFRQGKPLFLSSDESFSLNLYSPSSGVIYSFEFSKDTDYQRADLRQILLTLLFYLGLTALVSLWVWPLLRRLNTIRKSLTELESGRLDNRIEIGRFSYLRDIERGFNSAASRIESLLEDNRLLSRAVSHDLRTPIARLRFGVDVLNETSLDSHQKKNIEHLSRDLDAMESLVETLLEFAKLEQNNVRLNLEQIDLPSLTSALISEHHVDGVSMQVVVETPSKSIQADVKLLSMMLNNLIGNALRHASSQVRVSIRSESDTVQIVIEDDGDGIPLSERERVLLPFYRISASQGGHGMGLAIVARIAQWHDFTLHLTESSSLGGLEIRVVLSCEER